jgi:hypothetical protein
VPQQQKHGWLLEHAFQVGGLSFAGLAAKTATMLAESAKGQHQLSTPRVGAPLRRGGGLGVLTAIPDAKPMVRQPTGGRVFTIAVRRMNGPTSSMLCSMNTHIYLFFMKR